ncbi:MAG: hypothetical protein R3B69_02970 [Candidatus Paceibacterota bacterium]
MNRGGILTLFVFIVFISPVNAWAYTVVYETTFDTDPGWVVDQPEYYHWVATSSTYSVTAYNRPPQPRRFPDRYATIELSDFDPNQAWELSWDILPTEQAYYGAYMFGLYSPDHIFSNRTNSSNALLISSSTVNFYFSTNRFSNNGYRLNIVDGDGDNLGQGGTGAEFFEPDTWYHLTMHYATDTPSISIVMQERDSGDVVYSFSKILPADTLFSPTMQHLGVSLYPSGTNGSIFTGRGIDSYSKYHIDNVTLTQLGNTTEPESEPEPLSDLLLQYEPVLYFHEDEDYFPMNVEAFVEGSGLWDSRGVLPDVELISRGEGNALILDTLATTTDTSDWYLAFSSDEAGEYDVDAAKARYQALRASGKATSTYYAIETRDSYIDSLGETHEFIVLQYWYFYAMNNWREKGGFNNHEGDWESVFVFLDVETEEPLYVAFSAHHNDGSDTVVSESVRRKWNNEDLNYKKTNVETYVSLGSHAVYNQMGVHPTLTSDDQALGNGQFFSSTTWRKRYVLSTSSVGWSNLFEGKFGTDRSFDLLNGESGPQGPYYSNISGIRRFHEPVKWAGIDQILDYEIETPTSLLSFPKPKSPCVLLRL